MNLRIGSRGSQLALWQANHVAGLLRGQGHSAEIVIIKTTGDRMQEASFAQVGTKGMFTKEIEEALADGRVDLAVHSLKDLPTELPEPFVLAATPVRADPRDVLVSVKYADLAGLPKHAKVGTSSQRRRALLRALRPDLQLEEFRGNVDTRLRKLAEGQVDAILLAGAGLDRLDKTDLARERLDPTDFCPAASQGALGIETRKDDPATLAAVAFLDHDDTRFAVTAERTALAALGGGCQVPIGIYCRREFARDSTDGGWNEIFGVVASPQTGEVIRAHLHAPLQNTDPQTFGEMAAVMLIEGGADRLLASADEAPGGAA